jgi:hypothetical protein
MNLAFEIRQHFASELGRKVSNVAPNVSGDWECRGLHERLTSAHVSPEQLCDADAFFIVEPDAAVWTGCLSSEQFLLLLPAMMLVALSTDSPRVENLRGLLVSYLNPSDHATERQLMIANYLYQNLTTDQIAVVEVFIAKSVGGAGGIGAEYGSD